jgi:hypothetical protein
MNASIPGTPNTAEALAFLARLPHRWINLVSIEPDTENISAITRPKGHVDLGAFVDRWNGKRGLYWSVGEPRPDAPDRKLTKAQIGRILFVCADLDAGKGETFEAGRTRLAALIAQLDGNPIAPPTFTIDSGGGYPPFWQLSAPLDATPENIAKIEAQGRSIAAALGGDATFDVNRVMRLPGTINLPNAKKRAIGRSAAPATVFSAKGGPVDLDDLAAVWAPLAAPRNDGANVDAQAIGLDLAVVREIDTFDALPQGLRDRLASLAHRRPDFADFWSTGTKDVSDPSRSGQIYRLAGWCKGNGFTPNEFGALAWVWGHGYAGEWGDMDDWRIARHLARAWGNWDGGEHALRAAPAPSEVFAVIGDDFEIPVAGAVRRGPFCAPFKLGDPAALPKREWLYGKRYIRGFITATIAPGGLGKSSLVMVEALAMATGRTLLGHIPERPLRVLYINGEDPLDESQRRLAAACIYHGVTDDEIGGRLHIGSGRDHGLTLMRQKDGAPVAVAVDVAVLVEAITALGLDLIILDPFVSVHELPENDNGAINAVCKLLGAIAAEHACAFGLVHHVRKGAAGPQVDTQVDDARGAGALVAAVRVADVLNVMTVGEAKKAGIAESVRRMHFRVDNGKANMSPPAEAAEWFKLHSVALGNGDDVGAVAAWKLPAVSAVMTDDQAAAVLRAIEAGMNRDSFQSPQWAGLAVSEALDLGIEPRKYDARAAATLKTLVRAGLIERFDFKEPKKGKSQPRFRVIRKVQPGDMAFFSAEDAAE